MLDDADVASVATVEKPAARSPDTKAALQYLEASGARAISVTQGCGYVVIAVGFKPAASRSSGCQRTRRGRSRPGRARSQATTRTSRARSRRFARRRRITGRG